jgi:hypothetical protein
MVPPSAFPPLHLHLKLDGLPPVFFSDVPVLVGLLVLIVMQLVVKILRNAYTPLPLSCSRQLQQLVGMLLRADPDDRPTTTELLGLGIVRKHLQLLLALAQSPPRPLAPTGLPASSSSSGPPSVMLSTAGATRGSEGRGGGSAASTAAPAVEGDDQIFAGCQANAVRAAEAVSLQHAAAAGVAQAAGREILSGDGAASAEEGVDLGGGISLALRDMMVALQRMARAPLHGGSSSSSSLQQFRNKNPSAAAAAFEEVVGSSASRASQQVPRVGGLAVLATGDTTSAASSLGASGADEHTPLHHPEQHQHHKQQLLPSGASAAVAAFEGRCSSSGAGSVGSGMGSAAAAAAAYAAIPAPVALPGSKRKVSRSLIR